MGQQLDSLYGISGLLCPSTCIYFKDFSGNFLSKKESKPELPDNYLDQFQFHWFNRGFGKMRIFFELLF